VWGSSANAPQVRAGHSLDDAGCPLPIFEIPYDLLPIEDRVGLIQSDMKKRCRSNHAVTLA
jgi:hypothetical protein